MQRFPVYYYVHTRNVGHSGATISITLPTLVVNPTSLQYNREAKMNYWCIKKGNFEPIQMRLEYTTLYYIKTKILLMKNEQFVPYHNIILCKNAVMPSREVLRFLASIYCLKNCNGPIINIAR